MRKSIAEVLAAVAQAKSSEDKKNVLKQNDSTPLRLVLKFAYNESIEFLVPDTAPPFKPSESHESHGMLLHEARRLKIFVKGGGYDNLNQIKRESLFIEMLESVDKDDASVLVEMITKRKFKGLPKKVVEETFPELFA